MDNHRCIARDYISYYLIAINPKRFVVITCLFFTNLVFCLCEIVKFEVLYCEKSLFFVKSFMVQLWSIHENFLKTEESVKILKYWDIGSKTQPWTCTNACKKKKNYKKSHSSRYYSLTYIVVLYLFLNSLKTINYVYCILAYTLLYKVL